MSKNLLNTVSDYYTEKVREHGATPKGVDWNSKESQYLRFEKICQVLNPKEKISILDYGCGTGDLVSYLEALNIQFDYIGHDISPEMINLAREKFNQSNISFSTEMTKTKVDYIVGSGIFNVRFGFQDEEWEKHIIETLDQMNSLSSKGFAFNILSTYSDIDKRRKDLYYADPNFFFDLCKTKFSKYVSLIHDYPLYEFTILVKKHE